MATVWTWDANHFTLDDNTNHTWDGWHVDPTVPTDRTCVTAANENEFSTSSDSRAFVTKTRTRKHAA